MSEPASYPQLPSTVWWTLRERFVQSVPKQLTITYLMSVLSVQKPAASQYLRYLRDLGLVDDNDATTPLANDWRDDTKYAEVCKTIREGSYPEDLRNVATPGSPERAEVVRWLMHSSGLGKGAAENKAGMYLLLCEADVSQRDKYRTRAGRTEQSKLIPKRNKVTKSKKNTAGEHKTHREKGGRNAESAAGQPNTAVVNSALQLNVEIHLSPEMSAEQIDQVFGSMAKHLRIGAS